MKLPSFVALSSQTGHRYLRLAFVALCMLAATAAPLFGQPEDVEAPLALLWPDGAPGAMGEEEADRPSLTVYLAPEEIATGAAVVICPGGGYGHLAMDHEGHAVARWLNANGVAAFILQYRIAPYRHPAPLQDAQRALRTVRARAEEWKIDPSRTGILGFSAGGHLASTAGTHFDEGEPEHADPIERYTSRPDFMVLVYPVVSMATPHGHSGSKRNLLGDDPDAAKVWSMSNELQVSPNTPPAFLMHTTEDTGVPPENSILFYQALRRAGVPAEMHIFEKGRHGLGLAPDRPALSKWPQLCILWMRGRGLLESGGP